MPISRRQYDAAINFNFSKGGDSMGFKKTTEKKTDTAATQNKDACNIVHLAGTVELVSMGEQRAFALINPGNTDGKFVPCTLYGEGDAELADKLDQYQKGDQIKLVGWLRPWSQKIDDKWQNKLEVRITEIKSTPPARERGAPAGWHGSDDDIPF